MEHRPDLSETIIDGEDVDVASTLRPRPGVHVGRYLVLEPIGEGGMAAVFLAHDPQLHRNVAIKVLHPRSVPGASIDQARLVREAQALAKRSHPNLVQVYDVGTWGPQVFIAMEYVEGPSLQRWLETARDWQAVVQTLRAAGEGLAMAHEAGLVHRDFKPGNVLVGDDGRVRVADFGLARLGVQGEAPVETLYDEPTGSGDALRTAMTESGVAMGTPAYMAPEQHTGEPVDARCDQYAFCVTLYEGVHGARPFQVSSRELLLPAKLAGPPAPPPRAPDSPAWLRRIIAKGLSPEPAARFSSMRALLRELDRGLSRRRRRRGAAALLVTLGGTVGLTYAAFRSDLSERCTTEPPRVWEQAERQAVAEAFGRVGVHHGDDVLRIVNARLDGYVGTWGAMHRDACEATHVRGEQSDELLDLRMACLRRRGSELRATVSILADADLDVVDHAVEAVANLTPVEVCADLEALRATVAPPESPEEREQVEGLQERLAAVAAAQHAGRSAVAAADAGLVTEDARALGYAPLLAEALIVSAHATEPDDPAKAEALLREALTIAASGHDDRRVASAWIALLFNVGQVQARHDEAISLSVGAEATLSRLGEMPSLRADLESALGTIEWRRGRYEEAVRRYERAQALILDSEGRDDPRLRVIINNYGVVMMSLGRLDEAEAQFQRGLSHAQEAFGPQHPYVADSLLNLGLIHSERGEGERAQQRLEEALTVLRSVPDQNRRRIGQVLSNLVVATYQQGKLVQGRDYAVEARALLTAVHGEDHPAVAASLDGLGLISMAEGKLDEAQGYFEQTVEIVGRTLGEDHPNYAIASGNLAILRVQQGRAEDASVLANKARRVLDGALEPDNHYLLSMHAVWAEAELASGRAEGTVEILEQARDGIDDRIERARVSFALARALHATGGAKERVAALLREASALYDELGLVHGAGLVRDWSERRGQAPAEP